MSRPSFANPANLAILEEAYTRWQADPDSVDAQWQAFFEGLELAGGLTRPAEDVLRQNAVIRLIDAYRDLGHLQAHLDPLNPPPAPTPLLELPNFNLSEADLGCTIDPGTFLGIRGPVQLRELIDALKETYCRTIGVEFRHIQDTRVRRWLQGRMEPRRNEPGFQRREQMGILVKLHFAELFERFLQNRYRGQKRFSLEGAETLIPVLDALIQAAPDFGVQEYIVGMAHRGRLNVLANIIHKPYEEIFAEFEDNYSPDSIEGDGDVKYHLGFSGECTTISGQVVHISLTPNPSHLEAVDPVIAGRTRAKQQLFGDTERTRGIPIAIHGDAAFAGQGTVPETLNLANLSGYTVGGTIHLIVNNQIGFTTVPADARSTTYCTDVAKMIQAPIFHVNADDPESAVYIAQLALEFRQEFKRDVVIDLYCYRRHGHNEGDEPSFTQPVMYKKIAERPSVSAVYTQTLLNKGVLKPEEAADLDAEFQRRLDTAQIEAKAPTPRKRGMRSFTGHWKDLQAHYSWAPVDSAADAETLQRVVDGLSRLPEGFELNPKVAKLVEGRRDAAKAGGPIDWAFAELLAYGSLVLEGMAVRLSGQDSRRGTFSQRHAAYFDANTGQRYTPLAHLSPDQALFEVYDSQLSEMAVLGFEFGYSMDDPHTLVLWEAQFGDFANGAQVMIDQFITCSESKWQRNSGLVLLLPHGYEGQGPEHSSARLERFLQACAEDNIQVCNLTTPAQYFHVLRRQMKRDFRKPLIIMTPKSLLRHKDAVSRMTDLSEGSFREVHDDPQATTGVGRVVLCTGKVYYDLLKKRDESAGKNGKSVAIVRVEQLYPFPEAALMELLTKYGQARWVWAQEESQNMGAWAFIEPRLRNLGCQIEYVGRDASASPATGSHKVHEREQAELVESALTGDVPHIVRAKKLTGMKNGRADVTKPTVSASS